MTAEYDTCYDTERGYWEGEGLFRLLKWSLSSSLAQHVEPLVFTGNGQGVIGYGQHDGVDFGGVGLPLRRSRPQCGTWRHGAKCSPS